ncbi:MAG: heparinase II/III family protein [Planctomycetota bacterium]|nr:heparinase II/III family protein [Planctomycetota bacterium]MDA1141845.1 heparinase II/III family protein [Planctomycetota bacterium]
MPIDRYLRDRIENITEQDFWSSIRRTAELKPIVEMGLSGKKAAAYKVLGVYHSRTLANESILASERVSGIGVDSDQAKALRDRADKVVRHEINGWHTQVIKFGPEIDFNADFGCSGQYGFHYLGWMHPVLEQYLHGREATYLDCFLDITLQYYQQRDKIKRRIDRLHPVYYELGARAKVGLFLPAYACMASLLETKTSHREALLKLLLGMARSLFRLQETGFRPGNWQIVGAQSLFWMGCAFPEFKESAKWRERGLAIIMDHARRDFFEDGCHGERCWDYGWMSLDGMLRAYQTGILYNELGRSKAPLTRMLKSAFQWFAGAVSPTHSNLNYGDGTLGDASPVLERGKQLFPELTKKGGLLGVDRSISRIYHPSGYAFMVADDHRDSPFMSINFGKYGGGHTHADLLDFSIWCYGEPIIEEVGRFGSYDNPLDPFFRSEQAHNQIVLEHTKMNRIAHKGQEVVWHSTKEVDFFSASHTAYEARKAKITRQIIFVKPDYWVIYDVVDAPEKIFQVSNYLHAPKPFKILGKGEARVQGNRSCLIKFAEPDSIRHLTTAVDYSADDYTVPGGNATERHRLVATTWREVGDDRPIRFVSLLIPFKSRAPKANIQTADSHNRFGECEAFKVTVGKRQDVVVFNPARVKDFSVGKRGIGSPVAARLGRKWVEAADNKAEKS